MKTNEAVQQLPQYKCHKVVRAGRIQTCLGGVLAVQVGSSKALIEIDAGREWVDRHKPEHGGYLVVYEDGYLSYSPADIFEAGYHELPPLGSACGGTADAVPAPTEALVTDIPPHQLRVLEELAEVSMRLQKLVEFTGTDLFASLDEQERDRLSRQANAMGDYVSILGERVAAF